MGALAYAEGASLEPLDLSLAAGLSGPVVSQPRERGRWRVSVDAGPRVWQIHTPARASLRLDARTSREVGLGAQLGATREVGARAEFGLGLGVATIDYDPEFPTIVQPDRFTTTWGGRLAQAETLERVSVTVAQVPVDLRFDVLAGAEGHRRTRLWAKAGLAANVVLGSDYGLVREVGDIQTLSAPGPSGPVLPASELYSDSEEQRPGFFEPGGEFSENAFVTARLGLEAEVMLGEAERVSLFTAADYDRFLPLTDGLGVTDDQPSQLALRLGARVSL